MYDQIRKLTKKHMDKIVSARRYFHENPELDYEEYKSQKYIINILNELNIENYVSAKTGVVGIIRGKNNNKTVLLRGDMDALPINEEVDIPFKSKVENVMHACGHDGHMANLLGVAMVLNEIKDELEGNVKLMFQPAEETIGGAEPMIKEGILKNPDVDAAFGLHLIGELEYGTIQFKEGAFNAATDEFEVEIIGKGGHAASPHETIDPISVAIQFINNIQYAYSRNLDPVKPSLISFTKFIAGDGLNVIPNNAIIGGTIRNLYPDNRKLAINLFKEHLDSITKVNNATYNLNFMPSYPPLINDNEMTKFAKNSVLNQFDETLVRDIDLPSLGAEDFAYLAENVPSCYYSVGIWEKNKEQPVHHHPKFYFNDDVLEVSCISLATIAYDYLNNY